LVESFAIPRLFASAIVIENKHPYFEKAAETGIRNVGVGSHNPF
jgi:hypothetical protein